jgi:hypothetical protein
LQLRNALEVSRKESGFFERLCKEKALQAKETAKEIVVLLRPILLAVVMLAPIIHSAESMQMRSE